MSLATRLRALKVLSGPGKDCLDDPAKLKSILCPVIARTPAEQDRFYELFDRYMVELLAPLPEPPPTPIVPWWEKVPKAIWYGLSVLSLLALGYVFYQLLQPKPSPPKAFFQHDEKVNIGDTLHFVNLSERMDTADYHFTWELLNGEKNVNESAAITKKGAYHWYFIAEEEETNTKKTIRLTVQEKNKLDSIHIHESSFSIHCANPPKVLSIEGPSQAQIGEQFGLKANMENEVDYKYEWIFGADNVKYGSSINHQLDKEGSYQIRLNVTQEGVNGICRTAVKHPLKIGAEKAYLTEKALIKDPLNVVADIFTGWTKVLLSLIFLGMIGGGLYNLWKWSKRKAPIREEEMITDAELEEQFKVADRAPYFIPFRSKNGQIRTERDLFRFADVLRMRQEGLQKYIDVPNTINETIHKGGFPNFKYATRTEPSEYLFLIDQESTHSHQAKLFEYLAELMQEKDIYAVVYWYKRSFHRFWNEEHPDGFSLSLLHRLYPNHRVFVMGNGHELQDPFPEGKPALRKAEVADFKRWKERFLLSPLPPESWTFREGLLYDLFNIFPATLEGLNESSTYLERVLDQEDIRPSFKKWRDVFLTPPHEPDVNYRKWRSANDHRKYFTEHPELYQWLCALAVHQQPTWELTIAIGKALQPFGVEVTFDNLCLLARIPWLQTGDLHPRLRKDLLKALDHKAEILARAAVKKELEVVQDLVGNGHASRELNTNLAIQNFAIAPDQFDHQKTIRYLLNNGLLNKKQIADLNQNLERHEGKDGQSEGVVATTDKTKIHAFLDSQDATRIPLPKPFVTKHLIRAATYLGGLFLFTLFFLALVFSFNRTKKLHDWVFGERLEIENNDLENLRNHIFIEEILEADFAKKYNNIGVNLARDIDKGRGQLSLTQWLNNRIEKEELIVGTFEKALNVNLNYDLAKENTSKFIYNNGQRRYQAFLNDSVDVSILKTAIPYFEKVEEVLARSDWQGAYKDTLKWDNWHALGLTYFYLDQKDSAQNFLDQLKDAQPNYFSNLNQMPNLLTMLESGLVDQIEYKGTVIDAKTKKGVADIDIKGDNFVTTSNSDGEYFINLPKDYDQPTVSIRFKSDTYKRIKLDVERYEGNRLKPVSVERVNGDENFAEEEAAWKIARSKNTIAAYELFLKQFPDQRYTDEIAELVQQILEKEIKASQPSSAPIKWNFSQEVEEDNVRHDLIFKGKITPGWWTYGIFENPKTDFPRSTVFTFDKGDHFELIGEIGISGDQKGQEKRDDYLKGIFGETVPTYVNQIVFAQRVKVNDYTKPIQGYLTYQADDSDKTTAPLDVKFSFTILPPSPPIIEEVPEEEKPNIEQSLPDYNKNIGGGLIFESIDLYFDQNVPMGIGTNTSIPYGKTIKPFLDSKNNYLKDLAKSQYTRTEIDNFFAYDVISDYETFQAALSVIHDRLLSGASFEISLRGNASSLSDKEIGKNLTGRRIASIKLEILNYKDKALREFEYNGQLKFKEEPLANLTATGAVSELLDQKNPYTLEVARKRRVEILINEIPANNRK